MREGLGLCFRFRVKFRVMVYREDNGLGFNVYTRPRVIVSVWVKVIVKVRV